jgi:4-aminobutyrate aminotransferase-like enzyme
MSARGTSLALQRGLHISGVPAVADWVHGDDLRFYPPLVITREQLGETLDIIEEVLGELTREAGL